MQINTSNMSELAKMVNKQKADIYQEFLDEKFPANSLNELEAIKNKYLNRLQSLSDVFKILPESEKAFITAEIHFVINKISSRVDKLTLDILNEQNKKEKLNNKEEESSNMNSLCQTYISYFDYMSDITHASLSQVRTIVELDEVVRVVKRAHQSIQQEIDLFVSAADREKVRTHLGSFTEKFNSAVANVRASLLSKDAKTAMPKNGYKETVLTKLFNELSNGEYDKKPAKEKAACCNKECCGKSCGSAKKSFRVHPSLSVSFEKKANDVKGRENQYRIETTFYYSNQPINTQVYDLGYADVEGLVYQLQELLAK